jgi:predicted RNA-binding protein with PUA-like domain
MVDVGFVEKFPRIITLEELKGRPELEGMTLLRRGRLSVQPVEENYWQAILRLRDSG